MNIQKWLEKVKQLDDKIQDMLDEKHRLWAIAIDGGAKPFDGMPPDYGGTVSQKMQNAVCAVVDLDRKLNKVIDEFIDHKRDVITALNKLPELERCVLYRHYIKYESWTNIAKDLGYSRMQVWRIHKYATHILVQGVECYT